MSFSNDENYNRDCIDDLIPNVVSNIFASCKSENSDVVRISKLVNYMIPYLPQQSNSVDILRRILDPYDNDPEISCSIFQKLMQKWAPVLDNSQIFPHEKTFSQFQLPSPETSYNEEDSNSLCHNYTSGLRDQIIDLKHQNKKLNEALADVRCQLSSTEEVNFNMQTEIDNLRKQLSIEMKEKQNLLKKRELYHEQTEYIAKLQSTCETLTNKVTLYNTECLRLRSSFKELEVKNASLENNASKLLARENSSKPKLHKLQMDLNDREREIEILEQRYTEIIQKYEELENVYRSLVDENDHLKYENKVMENRLNNRVVLNENVLSYLQKINFGRNRIISDTKNLSRSNFNITSRYDSFCNNDLSPIDMTPNKFSFDEMERVRVVRQSSLEKNYKSRSMEDLHDKSVKNSLNSTYPIITATMNEEKRQNEINDSSSSINTSYSIDCNYEIPNFDDHQESLHSELLHATGYSFSNSICDHQHEEEELVKKIVLKESFVEDIDNIEWHSISLDDNFKFLKIKNMKLQNELDDASTTGKEIEVSLKKTIAELQNNITILENEKAKVELSLAENERSNEELKEQLAKRQRTVEDLSMLIGTLKTEKERHKRTLEEYAAKEMNVEQRRQLQTEYKEALERNETIKWNIEELRRKCEMYRDEKKCLQSDIEALRKENALLTGHINVMNKRIEHFRRDLCKKEKQLMNFDSTLSEKIRLEEQLEVYKKNYAQVLGNMYRLKGAAEKEKEMKETLERLNQLNLVYQSQIDSFKKEKDGLTTIHEEEKSLRERTILELSQKLDENENTISNLREQLDSSLSDCESIAQQLSENRCEKEQLQNTLSSVANKYANMKTRRKITRTEILRQRITKLKINLLEEQSATEKLKSELHQMGSACHELEEKLANAVEKLESLASAKRDVENENKELIQTLAIAEDTLETCRSEMKSLQEQFNEAECIKAAKVVENESAMKELVIHIDVAKRRIEEKRRQLSAVITRTVFVWNLANNYDFTARTDTIENLRSHQTPLAEEIVHLDKEINSAMKVLQLLIAIKEQQCSPSSSFSVTSTSVTPKIIHSEEPDEMKTKHPILRSPKLKLNKKSMQENIEPESSDVKKRELNCDINKSEINIFSKQQLICKNEMNNCLYRSVSEGLDIEILQERNVNTFPNIDDKILENLGLLGEWKINNLSQEEIEEKFHKLALAFSIGFESLKQRRELKKSERDRGEANLKRETEKLKSIVQSLSRLRFDSDSTKILDQISSQTAALIKAIDHITPSFEVFGSVQLESKLSGAMNLMIEYVKRLTIRTNFVRETLVVDSSNTLRSFRNKAESKRTSRQFSPASSVSLVSNGFPKRRWHSMEHLVVTKKFQIQNTPCSSSLSSSISSDAASENNSGWQKKFKCYLKQSWKLFSERTLHEFCFFGAVVCFFCATVILGNLMLEIEHSRRGRRFFRIPWNWVTWDELLAPLVQINRNNGLPI